MDLMDVDVNDEDYVIQRAKSALETNPSSAKAWMITAKTLYPNNFGVQFEAYKIEKVAGHVKESAKCFSDLIGKFQQQPEFWQEINTVTSALRSENDNAEPEKMFLCEMFKHISLDVQHKLLLLTADHCEDTQEHCKLLLLLLQRFPSSISTHGPGLVETLLSAEKHSHASNQPVNCYRRLLVCDLLPLLNTQSSLQMELPQKLVYKLLHKSIEYHLCVLRDNTFVTCRNKDNATENITDDSWTKLFRVIEFVGKQLGWEPYLTSFGTNWCKESYWQKLLTFCQSQSLNLEDPNMLKQLIYCLTMFLLYCLHQYVISLNSDKIIGQMHQTYVMVEGFNDSSLPNPLVHDPKSKRRKSDVDANLPFITTENSKLKNISSNFMMAVNCWDLLHSAENLNREFMKLSGILMLEPWLTSFLVDYLLYKAKYDEAQKRLDSDININPLIKSVLKANVYYWQSNYMGCLNHVCEALTILPTTMGTISTQLIVGGTQRHLHYLPLTRISILQLFCKLLLRSIRQNGFKNDMAIGHCFVLMQLDWPQEEEMLPKLMDKIIQTRAFYYLCFQTYIVQIDILEELAYLWAKHSGSVSLEIVPNIMTRRIGTRGADKGMKEDVKQAIRRQVARCMDPIDEILMSFLVQERPSLSHTLV